MTSQRITQRSFLLQKAHPDPLKYIGVGADITGRENVSTVAFLELQTQAGVVKSHKNNCS